MIRRVIAVLAIAVALSNAALYAAWGDVWNLRSALVAAVVAVLTLSSLRGSAQPRR